MDQMTNRDWWGCVRRGLWCLAVCLALIGAVALPAGATVRADAAARVSVPAPVKAAARFVPETSAGNENVTAGIVPSDNSAGYGWNATPGDVTWSMTFTEPTITCTGEASGYESSVDIGLLAETTAGLGEAGQSTIYTQNFCPSAIPIYRFDLSIPGTPYNGYGYGVAHPGDSITLTDTIDAAGTAVSYMDNTTGQGQTFTGIGGSLQTMEVGAFPIPGSVLAGFNPIAVGPVTANGANLGTLPDLGQVNLDVNSTIVVQTSNLSPDGSGFTMSYVNTSGPTVTSAAVTDGSTTEVPNGPVAGGTPLTITGTNFGNPGDNVSVTLVPQDGSTPIEATDATVVSSTEITATTADATDSIASGDSSMPTDVEVDVGGITTAAPQTFTYAWVWVDGVSTDTLRYWWPRVPMTVTGYGFTDATGLEFQLPGGEAMTVPAKNLTVSDDGTQIDLNSPIFPGIRLGFLGKDFESSYETDLRVLAGGFTSPVNEPDDEVTVSKPS